MKRRTIVFSLAASVGGLLALSFSVCGRSANQARLPIDRLDVLLANIPDARRLGASYRLTHRRDHIKRQVALRPELAAALAVDCPVTRLGHLKAIVREDFAAQRIRVENNWVVSDTECLVAGLLT